MIRPTSLIIFFACVWLTENAAISQTASQLRRDQLRGSLNVQNAKIGEQRVQRQTEIMRLEEILRGVEDRMIRLERRAVANSQPPLITIAEAEASVEFTLAQLKESEQRHTEGKISDVTLARHRLDHVRAQAQLDTSKFAHADRLIALELEVVYTEQILAKQTQQHHHLERLVAKGYSSSEGLKQVAYDVAIANKQVKQARLRLTLQRRVNGESNPETLLEVDSATDDQLPSKPATVAQPSQPPNTDAP